MANPNSAEDLDGVASRMSRLSVQRSPSPNTNRATPSEQLEILDHDVLSNGQIRYLVKRTVTKWQTQEEGNIPQHLLDEWLQQRLETGADNEKTENTIGLDRIIGHDNNSLLITWQRHPISGAELKPFWSDDAPQEMLHAAEAEWARIENELEKWREEHDRDESGFRGDILIIRSDAFEGRLPKPVSKVVREVVESKYPHAFDGVDDKEAFEAVDEGSK